MKRIAMMIVLTLSATVGTAAQVELLENGDAERGDVGAAPPRWVTFSYDGQSHDKPFPFVTTGNGRNGSKGMALQCPPGLQWVYVQQLAPVEPKPTHRAVFRAWLRADKPVKGVGFHLYLTPHGQTEGGFSTRRKIDVDTTWRRCEVGIEFAVAAKRGDSRYNLRPIVQLNTTDVQLELDDAELVIVASDAGTRLAKVIEEASSVSLGPDVVTVNAPVGVTGGIVPRPDGTLLVFDPGFGMRRSTDGGRTWSQRIELAIGDKDNHITGAIAMRGGALGIWTESWGRPMYFWRSDDEGKTWSKRYTMGPKGAPLHGNVMIETTPKDDMIVGKTPTGWNRQSMAKADESNTPDSPSYLKVLDSGHHGEHAAALWLDETDQWVYTQQRLMPGRPLKTGDQFVYRAAVRADKPAEFNLYIEAWNGKTNAGSRTRQRFTATTDWQPYEIKLDVGEPADGLKTFRVIVQLYTPGVELRFDDIHVERVAPDAQPVRVANAGFEQRTPGRLVIPCREGHSVHGGLWKGAAAYGITHDGKRVLTESHAHALEMDITFVYFSDDGGRNWRRSDGDIIIWKDDGYGGMWPVDEPNVAELKDGRLIMLARSTLGRLYQAFSEDGGKQWSYPEPTDLPSSYSPCALERIEPTGDLLCVWNNVSHDEIKRGFRRGRLSVALSKDDGKTWINVKTIDTAGLPAIDGVAELSEPGMIRAEKDLGDLPLPFGNVHYPDITVAGDNVLIKYGKSLVNPKLSLGAPMHIIPLKWFYD